MSARHGLIYNADGSAIQFQEVVNPTSRASQVQQTRSTHSNKYHAAHQANAASPPWLHFSDKIELTRSQVGIKSIPWCHLRKYVLRVALKANGMRLQVKAAFLPTAWRPIRRFVVATLMEAAIVSSCTTTLIVIVVYHLIALLFFQKMTPKKTATHHTKYHHDVSSF